MGAWRLDCEFVTYPPWVASSETSRGGLWRQHCG